MTINIFVSYSHKDKLARDKFQTHLTPLTREGVELWYDDRIPAGGELDPEIRRALRKADIFVALASPDYLRSEYCYVTEYGYALRRAARKSMYVVVAVIRPCQWKHTRMGRYKALPNDGKPTTQWTNRDLAYEDIAEGVRRVVAMATTVMRPKAVAKATRKTPEPSTKQRRSAPRGKAQGAARNPATPSPPTKVVARPGTARRGRPKAKDAK